MLGVGLTRAMKGLMALLALVAAGTITLTPSWAPAQDQAAPATAAAKDKEKSAAKAAYSAPAVPADEVVAGQIRQAIEQWLLDFFPSDGVSSEAVRLYGQVTVEPSGDSYGVTLPQVFMIMDDGSILDLGMMTMVLEQIGPTRFRIAAQFAAPFQIYDQEGQAIGQLKLGNQDIKGVWDTRYQTMVQMDASVEDIALTYNDIGDVLRIDRLSASVDYTDDEQLLLSGPSTTMIENLQLLNSDGKVLLRIGQLKLDSEVRGMNLIAYNQFARSMSRLAMALVPPPPSLQSPEEGIAPAPDEAGAPPPGMSREERDLLLGQMQEELQGLPGFFSDMGMALTITDLVANEPSISAGLSLGSLSFSLLFKDMLSEQGSMRLAYQHKGLEFLPKPFSPDPSPRDISINMRVDKIPLLNLWSVITEFPHDVALYGEENGAAYNFDKLIHRLAIGDTEIHIDDTFINTEAMDARITGIAAFDNQTPYKIVVAANIRLIGLNELLEALTANSDPPPGSIQTIIILKALQEIGHLGEKLGGRSNWEYRFEIDQYGSFLINEQEIFEVIKRIFAASEDNQDAQ